MERRTQADKRREEFNRQGKIARDLADLAMAEIDEALLEQSHLYRSWTGAELHPITDDDTLASPIGYYETPRSILE